MARILPYPPSVLFATRCAVPKRGSVPASIHGFGTSLRGRPSLRRLRRLLASARPGQTYELVVHPGVPDAELERSGDGYRKGRELEHRLLCSDEFRAVMRNAGLGLPGAGPSFPPGKRLAAGDSGRRV